MRSFVECGKKIRIFFLLLESHICQHEKCRTHTHIQTKEFTKNVVKKEDRKKFLCSFLSCAHREGLEIYTSLKINSWVLERANGE